MDDLLFKNSSLVRADGVGEFGLPGADEGLRCKNDCTDRFKIVLGLHPPRGGGVLLYQLIYNSQTRPIKISVTTQLGSCLLKLRK